MKIQTKNPKLMAGWEEIIVPAGCVFMGFRGSIAHGMFVPSEDPDSIDDIDMFGVYIESPGFYLGLENKMHGFGGTKSDTKVFWEDNYDVEAHELRKFFGLLWKGNPNAMSMLWLPKHRTLVSSDSWEELFDHRDVFVTKKPYHAFMGYAKDQRSKMDRTEHQGYMGQKRRELVNRFGYDTKNAAHMIRLLRMCHEYLTTGNMKVDRSDKDAQELLSIKKGKYSKREVLELADTEINKVETAYAESPLPEAPNFYDVSNLCTSIIRNYYEEFRYAG